MNISEKLNPSGASPLRVAAPATQVQHSHLSSADSSKVTENFSNPTKLHIDGAHK